MAERIARQTLLLDEEAAFGDGGPFSGSELAGRVKNVDQTNVAAAEVPIELNSLLGGVHPPAKGMSKVRDGVPFEMYLEGLGTAATGAEAVATAQTRLFSAAYQQDPDLTTGSAAAAAATTTSVGEKTVGAHTLVAAEAIGLAAFEVVIGGLTKYQIRPYYYDSPNLKLLMELGAAPAEDAVVYGAANLRRVDDWAEGAMPLSLAIKMLSTTIQNAHLKGCAVNFNMGETLPGVVPSIQFTPMGVSHESRFVEATPTLPDFVYNVAGGGEVAMAKHDSTVLESIAAPRVSWPDFRTFILDGDINAVDPDTGEPAGGGNWSGQLSPAPIHIWCRIAEVPPAACGSVTFEAMAYSQDERDRVQVLTAFGRTPGRMAARYLHTAVIRNWVGYTDSDGVAMQEFDCVPYDGLSSTAAVDAVWNADCFAQL